MPYLMELGVCEVVSTFFVACFATIWGYTCRFLWVKCCQGRGRRSGISRAPVTASCDIIKSGLGTLAAYLVVCLNEAFFFSHSLWALLIRWVLVVGVSLPFSLLCWSVICNHIRHAIADGKIMSRSILRSLQCSGRYNPRQRMGLADGDCLDFRVEDEEPVGEGNGSGEVVAASAAPRTSWWAFQCLVWFLVQGLVSILIAALITSWQKLVPQYDPAALLGKELEAHVLFLGCGETALGWAVALTLTMILAVFNITVADNSQRYYGRLAHAGLGEAATGDSHDFGNGTLNSLGGGGVTNDSVAHDGTAAASTGPTIFSKNGKSKHGVAAVTGSYL